MPLVSKLMPIGRDYRRNYVRRLRIDGQEVDDAFAHDVVSEMWFDDEDGYRDFAAEMTCEELRCQIIADEERFLDRSKSIIMIVDEHPKE